jgi:hypothetical protein
MHYGRTVAMVTLLVAMVTLLVAALAPTAAHARTPPPKLTGLRCVPRRAPPAALARRS